MNRVLVLLLALLPFACATTPSRPSSGAPAADILLTNGRIFTGVESSPFAEAIAIRGDTIVAVGTRDAIRALAGSSTREIDLRGRLVIPGINDAHVHAPWPREEGTPVAIAAEGVTKESFLAALRTAASQATPGAMLIAELPRALIDAGLTRDDLDAFSASVRIRIDNFGGHSSLLNTAALRSWDIGENASDSRGAWYGRSAGRLNGWVYEHALWAPQVRVANAASDDDIRMELEAFEDEMLRYGVTSVQTMPVVAPSRLEGILRSMSPKLRWRIVEFRMAPYPGAPGRFPVKYIFDGTPIERSTAMQLAYADDARTRGTLNYSDEDIRAIVRDAAQGEKPRLVHAVGYRAIGALLDAMVATPADWPSRRVRIEHGDMITPAQIETARQLGAILVQNPAHFTIPDMMQTRFGVITMRSSQPARSLLEKGNRFAIGSDGPLNPFLNIFFAAIHPVNPDEALSVAQSLRAYTSGAAFAEFEEKRKGTIAPGMLADLAVLSQDIFNVPPQELPRTVSELTIVGGRIAHEQSAASAARLQ